MKTIRPYRFPVLTALFIAAFVTVSCDFPDGLPAPGDPDTIPEGEGALTITLPGNGASASGRSILPDGLSGSLAYMLTLTKGAETKNVPDVTGGTYTINLTAGTWNVTATARDSSDVLVGTGSATVAVAAGQRVYTIIVMAPAGTYAENIYIHSEAELRRYLADYDGASVTFHLENDITVTGSAPVDDYFEGTLDGHGHTIILNLNVSGGEAGLLGSNYGTVKNLRLEGTVAGSPVYSFFSAGAVAAGNNGAIRNVSSAVTVTALNIYDGTGALSAGGIAGGNAGTIEDCSTGGNVTGNRNAGTGDPDVGGIAGKNENSGTINRCYAYGNVTTDDGSGSAGGIAGFNEGTISNCAALNSKVYNSSTLTNFQGRVAGYNYGSGTLTFNYAYTDMQAGDPPLNIYITGTDRVSNGKHGADIPGSDLGSPGSDAWWTTTAGVGWPAFLPGKPTFEPGALPSEPDGPSPWYWRKTITILYNDVTTLTVTAYVPALWFE